MPYFHVVFTLPAAAAEIAFHNKAVVYALLFRAAAEALRSVAADPRYLGAEIGAIAVLHTWGQTLHHHPHLHCIVTAMAVGGLAKPCRRMKQAALKSVTMVSMPRRMSVMSSMM